MKSNTLTKYSASALVLIGKNRNTKRKIKGKTPLKNQSLKLTLLIIAAGNDIAKTAKKTTK